MLPTVVFDNTPDNRDVEHGVHVDKTSLITATKSQLTRVMLVMLKIDDEHQGEQNQVCKRQLFISTATRLRITLWNARTNMQVTTALTLNPNCPQRPRRLVVMRVDNYNS